MGADDKPSTCTFFLIAPIRSFFHHGPETRLGGRLSTEKKTPVDQGRIECQRPIATMKSQCTLPRVVVRCVFKINGRGMAEKLVRTDRNPGDGPGIITASGREWTTPAPRLPLDWPARTLRSGANPRARGSRQGRRSIRRIRGHRWHQGHCEHEEITVLYIASPGTAADSTHLLRLSLICSRG